MLLKNVGQNGGYCLPPAAMGPVVALIGLELSATAAKNAGLIGDNIQMANV
ncbi:MAG: hypothetical protein ACLRQF_04535 [Thomasclavelia ramosa]